jgi:hypothetical protein
VEDPAGLAGWDLQHGPFLSAEDALNDFLSLNIGFGVQAELFASELRLNYGVFGGGR